MNIDESTGLPELPDGYFWRVTRGSFDYSYIQIRRKRFLGSAKVTDCIMEKSYMNHWYVMQRARSAFKDFQNRGNYKQFVGNYPPNKL